MRFERHEHDQQINPALKVAAMEAARLVSLAEAMPDVADLTGLRHDAPAVDAILRLRDELRAEAKATITKEIAK